MTHFIVQCPSCLIPFRKRNVRFVFNIVARVIPDSVVSAVVRLGVAIILVLSMLLGLISLASLAQQNLQVSRIRR